jgi:hypothetical protein
MYSFADVKPLKPEKTLVHFHSLKPIRQCSLVDVLDPAEVRRKTFEKRRRSVTLALLQVILAEKSTSLYL